MSDQTASHPSPGNGSGANAVLTVTSGAARGATIEIDENLLIGRHAPGAGRLGGDQQISRNHALISRTPTGAYVIQDLGSMNGTFVNSGRVSGAQQLAAGDTIEVGDTVLVVSSAGAPQAPPATVAPSDRSAGLAPSPVVRVRIDVDIDRGEASIRLDEGSDRVDLVHRDGRWRLIGGD